MQQPTHIRICIYKYIYLYNYVRIENFDLA